MNICIGSPESSLLDSVISTKIACAYSLYYALQTQHCFDWSPIDIRSDRNRKGSCVDLVSFDRGVQCFDKFFKSSYITEGIGDLYLRKPLPIRQSEPTLAHQQNATSMAFRWWADDDLIFQGVRTSSAPLWFRA